MNYFDKKSAAERYSKGRPGFHHNTIQHIKNYLRLDRKIDKALDIACGTGLSTKALLEIAKDVYGTDISQEMLSLAPQGKEINYAIAPAEQQPFTNNFFDLITVSSGVHWFDIDKFLIEANRILKSKAWLVLYENYFIAEMIDNPDFTSWFRTVYLDRFPTPPRNEGFAWTNENLKPKNFTLVNEESFKNAVLFSKQQLALYFTTQSNIIAAVEKNETGYEEVENWLSKELSAFFDDDAILKTINYGNWIKFIQKEN